MTTRTPTTASLHCRPSPSSTGVETRSVDPQKTSISVPFRARSSAEPVAAAIHGSSAAFSGGSILASFHFFFNQTGSVGLRSREPGYSNRGTELGDDTPQHNSVRGSAAMSVHIRFGPLIGLFERRGGPKETAAHVVLQTHSAAVVAADRRRPVAAKKGTASPGAGCSRSRGPRTLSFIRTGTNDPSIPHRRPRTAKAAPSAPPIPHESPTE